MICRWQVGTINTQMYTMNTLSIVFIVLSWWAPLTCLWTLIFNGWTFTNKTLNNELFFFSSVPFYNYKQTQLKMFDFQFVTINYLWKCLFGNGTSKLCVNNKDTGLLFIFPTVFVVPWHWQHGNGPNLFQVGEPEASGFLNKTVDQQADCQLCTHSMFWCWLKTM